MRTMRPKHTRHISDACVCDSDGQDIRSMRHGTTRRKGKIQTQTPIIISIVIIIG